VKIGPRGHRYTWKGSRIGAYVTRERPAQCGETRNWRNARDFDWWIMHVLVFEEGTALNKESYSRATSFAVSTCIFTTARGAVGFVEDTALNGGDYWELETRNRDRI
jgi:hypothetical protein